MGCNLLVITPVPIDKGKVILSRGHCHCPKAAERDVQPEEFKDAVD